MQTEGQEECREKGKKCAEEHIKVGRAGAGRAVANLTLPFITTQGVNWCEGCSSSVAYIGFKDH
jgi:hypothetical protein